MEKSLIFIFCYFLLLPFVISEDLPPADDWSDVNLSEDPSVLPDDWSDVDVSDDWSEVNITNEEINQSGLAQTEVSDDTSETVNKTSSSKYSNINKKIVNLVTTGNIYGVKTGAYYFALIMGGVFLVILSLFVYLFFVKPRL